jgi:hypothetical protein
MHFERFGRQDFHDEIRTRRLLLDDLDAEILAILDKSPFESTRSIAETLNIAHSTMLLYLHDSVGLKSFHLQWVPHLVIHDLRQKRKEYAQPMLSFLHVVERDGWYHLVTGDESCFFLNTSPRRMWTLSKDNVITKPRLDLQRQKIIFTIIWNPSGFCVVDRLPNDTKMTATIL